MITLFSAAGAGGGGGGRRCSSSGKTNDRDFMRELNTKINRETRERFKLINTMMTCITDVGAAGLFVVGWGRREKERGKGKRENEKCER